MQRTVAFHLKPDSGAGIPVPPGMEAAEEDLWSGQVRPFLVVTLSSSVPSLRYPLFGRCQGSDCKLEAGSTCGGVLTLRKRMVRRLGSRLSVKSSFEIWSARGNKSLKCSCLRSWLLCHVRLRSVLHDVKENHIEKQVPFFISQFSIF